MMAPGVDEVIASWATSAQFSPSKHFVDTIRIMDFA